VVLVSGPTFTELSGLALRFAQEPRQLPTLISGVMELPDAPMRLHSQF
jgi:hypothetical protein